MELKQKLIQNSQESFHMHKQCALQASMDIQVSVIAPIMMIKVLDKDHVT